MKLEDLKDGVVGLLFGIVLSRIGFSSWDQVHAMFTFASFDLLIAFCLSVVLLTVAWRVVARFLSDAPNWPRRDLHRGTIIGGVLFGVGWAVCGACPSIALVQLGEGQMMALWTVGGVFVGNWLFAVVNARWLHWDVGSCLGE